jgi:translation initiation factor IF-3
LKKPTQKTHKINGEVRFPSVRLIGRGEPILLSSKEAYNIAVEEGKDLVLINETANPPVVRIDDYSKFLYEQAKLEKERKKNAPKNEIKEIQISVNIGENDFNTMLKRAIGFLKEGAKIKCVLAMKGRQKARPELGEITILKFITELDEFGTPEAFPKMENFRWLAIIKPKRK